MSEQSEGPSGGPSRSIARRSLAVGAALAATAIIVPSGALLGLDAVTAAAEGKINAVRMISRKPVKALLGAAHLVAKGIDISDLKEPMKVFSGSAAEAAIGFPRTSTWRPLWGWRELERNGR